MVASLNLFTCIGSIRKVMNRWAYLLGFGVKTGPRRKWSVVVVVA